MPARMNNPVMIIPEAMQALQALAKSTENASVPATILGLIELRASQINGCGVCLDMHARFLKMQGESDERLFAVAAWRDTPYFTAAERAALALAEAATRLSDRPDPVPDHVWTEATQHFDERQLSTLLLRVALINVWNRLNVPTRQVAGEWMKSAEAKRWIESQAASR